MIPKPKHLRHEYAVQFQDRSIVEAYHYRPPYPDEVFEILASLMTDEPRTVLDVGAGTGDIARRLVHFVERIDAIDFSQNMIGVGRRLPEGDNPELNWICGSVESTSLLLPYSLLTAGESLHWMEWSIVLPRFQKMLTPRGYLALIGRSGASHPWDAELRKIIPRFTTNHDYQPYNLIKELELRGLFQKHGEKQTAPVPFVQSVDDYVESFHSRNGFSRERMCREMATAFDNEVRELVTQFSRDGMIKLEVVGEVVWGKPKGL